MFVFVFFKRKCWNIYFVIKLRISQIRFPIKSCPVITAACALPHLISLPNTELIGEKSGEGDCCCVIDLRVIAMADSSPSFFRRHWEGWKDYWGERFAILDNYAKFVNRDKPIPKWSDSDVEEFIASDPVYGPTVCIS